MRALITTLSLLATTFIGVAHAAPGWWSPLPLEVTGDISDATRALLDAHGPRPDLFEPLWAERSHLADMKAAFGDPVETTDRGAFWYFTNLSVRIDETVAGVSIIELDHIDEPQTRQFDAGRVAFGAFAAGTRGCGTALSAFGRPSSVVGDGWFYWSTLGRGRDVHVEVGCSPFITQSTVTISMAKLPADRLAQISRPAAPVALPKTFVPLQRDAATPADPRPLWPSGIAPGQSLHTVIAALGSPSASVPRDEPVAFWGPGLMVTFVDGVVTSVTFGTHTPELKQRLHLSSPLFSAIGAPLAALTKRLGRPITSASEETATWFWDADGHELWIRAHVQGAAVQSLELGWRKPPDQAALACKDALAAPPTQPQQAGVYVSPTTSKTLAELVPFGLWFGATQRDVFDRVGLPRTCNAEGMQYRGLWFQFAGGKLERVGITPALLPPALRGRKDPLVGLLAADDEVVRQALGASRDSYFGRIFERGTEHVRVILSLDDPDAVDPTTYIASSEHGFDLGRIHGLDFADLTASAVALKAPSLAVNDDVMGTTHVEISLAARTELAGRVHGLFVDLVGAPWTTIVAALGDPNHARASPTELYLEWSWDGDPLHREIAYRCSGETPTCHTLVVGSRYYDPL